MANLEYRSNWCVDNEFDDPLEERPSLVHDVRCLN